MTTTVTTITTTNGIIHMAIFFTPIEEYDSMPHYRTVVTRNAQIILVIWLEKFNESIRITVL
jgi:hypothetical protein